MTELDFITQIQDEITASGSLPVVIEEREIQRIIKQQSKWAFENYSAAVESQFYIIKLDQFSTPEFKQQRCIQLPECIVSITECKEVSGAGRMGNMDKDFSMDKLVAADVLLSPMTGDNLVLRTAQMSFYDLTKAYFLSTIAFDYNRNTHKLRILGRNPQYDVFLNTYVKIPMDKLFEDYYFTRLCVAQSKLSFARILSTYTMELPGGVTIDSSSIRSEGETEFNEIKEKIDSENSPSWFLIWH